MKEIWSLCCSKPDDQWFASDN